MMSQTAIPAYNRSGIVTCVVSILELISRILVCVINLLTIVVFLVVFFSS